MEDRVPQKEERELSFARALAGRRRELTLLGSSVGFLPQALLIPGFS
jgi:hypothetical protein